MTSRGHPYNPIGNQYRLRYVDFNNVSAASATCGLWDYGIMEDIGFIELTNEEQGTEAEEVAHLV